MELFNFIKEKKKIMKNHRVELICSEIMHIEAESPEEAERFARDKFGNDYLIDEVHVTEKTE